MKYYNLNETSRLKYNDMVIAKCPEWNEEGFQIATWNGKEFEYSGQSNDMFNGLVTGFMPINTENGHPRALAK